jgi:methylenetetrahydrofolate dehydrogenase (NADP+)/methenyltetrahydrofolate cyclohydrolase
MILTEKEATVTLCHKNTENLERHTRESDILITATGKPNIIEKEMVSKDTFLIDAGYESGKISETEKVENYVSKLSPEPGGVGPVTVAMTLKNLLKCYKVQKG